MLPDVIEDISDEVALITVLLPQFFPVGVDDVYLFILCGNEPFLCG